MNAALRQTFRSLTQRRTSQPTEVSEQLAPRALTAMPAVDIPLNDPLYAYCLHSSGVVEIESLKIKSEAVTRLRAAGVRLLIPLVNRGEMVGMLQLGNRMSDQEYSSDDFRLLGNLARNRHTVGVLRYAQERKQDHQFEITEILFGHRWQIVRRFRQERTIRRRGAFARSPWRTHTPR